MISPRRSAARQGAVLQESSRSAFDRGTMIHVMGDLEKQMVDRCLQTPSTCTGKCGIVAVPSLPLPGPTTRRLERQGVFAEYLPASCNECQKLLKPSDSVMVSCKGPVWASMVTAQVSRIDMFSPPWSFEEILYIESELLEPASQVWQ